MIIVDTNVISEVARPAPNALVAAWLEAARLDELYTTAICEAELLSGLALMPPGRRRNDLSMKMTAFLAKTFANRILPFDSEAAPHYAGVVARRTELGRPIGEADAQIAAICRRHGAALATRDAGGFEGLEIEIVNPWTDDRRAP